MPVTIELNEWNVDISTPREVAKWKLRFTKEVEFSAAATPTSMIARLWLHFQEVLEDDDWQTLRQALVVAHQKHATTNKDGP